MKYRNIVLMHGWGVTSERLRALAKELETSGWKVMNMEFPGFGLPEPDSVWDLADYANFVDSEISEKWKENGYILFGHSFGGRVALKMVEKKCRGISALVLCAPGGMVAENKIKLIIFKLMAKGGKLATSFVGGDKMWKRIIYRLARTHDYEKASLKMREIMKRIIAENIPEKLKYVKIKTLILWGKEDRTVPVGGGYSVKEALGDLADLEIKEGIGHRLPTDEPKWVAERINQWYL